MKYSPRSSVFSKDGFSLMEVLVALVVFAIGIGGMLTALGYHLRDVSFTEDHARAVRIASREINALRRMRYFPEEEFSGQEDRFSWLVSAEQMDPDKLPGMEDLEENLLSATMPCLMSVTVEWSATEGGNPVGKVYLEGVELFREP